MIQPPAEAKVGQAEADVNYLDGNKQVKVFGVVHNPEGSIVLDPRQSGNLRIGL